MITIFIWYIELKVYKIITSENLAWIPPCASVEGTKSRDLLPMKTAQPNISYLLYNATLIWTFQNPKTLF